MAEIKPEALVTPVNGNHQPAATKLSAPEYPQYTPPPALPRPPFIDVEGIPNFRDVGGYLCSPYGQSGTHVVRPSLIYRCAHPTQVTASGGKTLLDDLHIRAVYDLRSAPEVTRTNMSAGTSTALPTTGGLNSLRQFTPVYTTDDYSPDVLARKLAWYSSSPSSTDDSGLPPFSKGFLNAYRDISNHGITAYKTIFTHILTRPSDPLVFHCTAGKDRTGVIAAIILRLCGVDDETIAWEYALTEPGLGIWRDIFMQRMRVNGLGGGGANTPQPSAEQPAAPKVNGAANGDHEQEPVPKKDITMLTPEEASRVCGSRAGNMRAYLKLVLDGEFGGAEAYLQNKLGFSGDQVQQIKQNLLVPVDEVRDQGKIVRVVGIEGWTPDGGVTDEFQRGKRM